MFESIKVIVHQVTEALAEGGVRNVFRSRVFWNRLATPVAMDLLASNFPLMGNLRGIDFQFTEITMEDLRAGKWLFAVPSRGLKAFRNLKKGFRSFAVTKDSIVVGDVWCIAPRKDRKRISHIDLKMLGIICGEMDAYAFDMFIATAYRGKNLAVPLQRSLQSTLKMEGCQRVYGYYWNDNLPALWMHRMLKFKELPKRSVSRFFFLYRSKAIGSTESASQKVHNTLP
jgi:GNAT superfamily N-acetyltransferase